MDESDWAKCGGLHGEWGIQRRAPFSVPMHVLRSISFLIIYGKKEELYGSTARGAYASLQQSSVSALHLSAIENTNAVLYPTFSVSE